MNNEVIKLSLFAASIALASQSVQAENITFWHGQTGKLGDGLQALCDSYNAKQSENKVTCIGQGGNEVLMQKTIAAYRTKNHPELVLGFDAGTLDLMLSNAILPVQELSEKLGDPIKADDFIPGIRSYYESSKGELYAQPFNASTIVLMGNENALKKAGVNKLPETWEEFETVLIQLKNSGEKCPFSTDGHPWRFLEQFSAVQGVPVATNGNGYTDLKSEYIFSTTPHVRIMNDLVKWRNDGLLKLSPDTIAGNYVAAFTSGECAMSLVSTGAYGQAYMALKDKTPILIGKMPIYDETTRHNSTVGGGAVWVMKGHSDEKNKASLDFLKYLRSNEAQNQYVRTTGYLPVTKEAFQQITESPEASNSEFATVNVGISSLSEKGNKNTKGVRLGFYVQFREIWLEETQKAFTGKQSMDDALNNAEIRGNQLLERFDRTYKNHTLP